MTPKHVGEYLLGFLFVAHKESIQTAEYLSLVLIPSKRGSLEDLIGFIFSKEMTHSKEWKVTVKGNEIKKDWKNNLKLVRDIIRWQPLKSK
jgi:hypothetical protein